MRSFTKWKILLCLFVCIASLTGYATGTENRKLGSSSEEAFDNPGLYSAKQLFELAKNALKAKKFDDARLFALRIYFDGFRSKSLLNLLGIVEVNDGRPLLASIWFRKSLSLGIHNRLAQRYLARLPGKIKPIPVDPTRLAEHFTRITEELPELLEQLVNPKLHFNAIMKSLQRGQIYKALALAEEYEKNYPGPDGASLTALCAWKLGRNQDAIQIVKNNLSKSPYHPLLLFVKAVIEDTHPGSSSPSYFRALYDLDKWAKALKAAKEFEKIFPESPDALIVRARIMLDMHKLPEARKALEEASIKAPGNPEIDLLWVEYFLQNNNRDRAGRRLSRAFRRGYNLPSVSLTAGLFALQAGRANEVNVILNDARTGRPFTDPDAYPLYITLLLMNDQTIEARDAIDEWSDRTLERSMYYTSHENPKTGKIIYKPHHDSDWSRFGVTHPFRNLSPRLEGAFHAEGGLELQTDSSMKKLCNMDIVGNLSVDYFDRRDMPNDIRITYYNWQEVLSRSSYDYTVDKSIDYTKLYELSIKKEILSWREVDATL
jgi:tetratricopeptide (TPR) repeat protein